MKQQLLKIIHGRGFTTNLTIKETIETRLSLFNEKGIASKLKYSASICDFNDLLINKDQFNRVLFNLLSEFSEANHHLKNSINIKANNCSQFFILSIDCNGCDLPPLSNGLAPSSERCFSPTTMDLQNIGGHILHSIDEYGNPLLILRIPLQCNEDQGSPLRRASLFA